MYTTRIMLAVCWTAFIVFALTRSASELPSFRWFNVPGADKAVHTILFAVEGFLVLWAIPRSRQRALVPYVLIGCVALGGMLELAQHYFVNGRTGDTIDLMADALGTLLGMVLVLRTEKFFANVWNR